MSVSGQPEEQLGAVSERPKATRARTEAPDDALDTAAVVTGSHPLLAGLATLPEGKQVEVLLRALLAERMMQKPEELHDLRQKAAFLHTMQQSLIEFAEALQQEEKDIGKTKGKLDELFDPKKRKKRDQTLVARNQNVDLIDGITKLLEDETIKLAAMMPVSKEYVDEAKPEDERVADERVLMTDPRINETEARVGGYLALVDHMYKKADEFPQLCRNVVRHVEGYKKHLMTRYGPGQDEEREEGHMGLFALLGGFEPPEREDVPIYKNNLHLTAFLHSVYRQIPDIREEEKKKTAKKGKDGKKENELDKRYDPAEVKAFANYLRALGDKKVLEPVQKGGFFPKVAEILERLYFHYRIVKENMKSTGIEDLRGRNPDSQRMRYRNRMRDVMKKLRLQGEDNLETFNPRDSIAMLAKIELTQLPLPQMPADAKAGTDKERKILAVFKELEDDLVKIMEGCPDPTQDWDVETWVRELMDMKYDGSAEKKKKRRRSRIRIDQNRDNFRYEAVTAGIGGLKLEQIPTEDITFDDVFGESWKEVRARFDSVLKFAELEMVHTRLGPRRKMSAHTLVLGPFGCGKNHFSRALTSDPRVVGVETSVGRLLTAWAGESEANIGRLFREAHKKRVKHEKPAIIVADEFDAFFGKNGQSTVDHMLQRMQKELQTMLDGNVDYDGVFMFGLSNEPHNIPPEIYRRMGQQRVFVIKAMTGKERVGLAQHLLSGIPLSPDFKEKVDMKEFEARTEHASGETIGKIVEYTYEMFRTMFDQKHHQRLLNIEETARDAYGQGQKFTPGQKVRLFQKGVGKDIRVTPEMFHLAVDQVIDSPQVQAEMRGQKRFYADVYDMLSAAFEGRKWPDPGFEPPSHGIKESDD